MRSNYTQPTVKTVTLAPRGVIAFSITGTTESTDSALENPEMGGESDWD